jgi:hypothetical protein
VGDTSMPEVRKFTQLSQHESTTVCGRYGTNGDIAWRSYWRQRRFRECGSCHEQVKDR